MSEESKKKIKYCVFCGEDVGESKTYCPHCGKWIEYHRKPQINVNFNENDWELGEER